MTGQRLTIEGSKELTVRLGDSLTVTCTLQISRHLTSESHESFESVTRPSVELEIQLHGSVDYEPRHWTRASVVKQFSPGSTRNTNTFHKNVLHWCHNDRKVKSSQQIKVYEVCYINICLLWSIYHLRNMNI